ncbi:hypothetical protein V6N13_074868 [Hibiscus sabdariffa]|uniref:Uncharacterized protein n=1 Tax=Hibiscus sabdariffa TaxID=183260 RepID=A0ABR2U9U4_9ROSI
MPLKLLEIVERFPYWDWTRLELILPRHILYRIAAILHLNALLGPNLPQTNVYGKVCLCIPSKLDYTGIEHMEQDVEATDSAVCPASCTWEISHQLRACATTFHVWPQLTFAFLCNNGSEEFYIFSVIVSRKNYLSTSISPE